MPNTRTPSAAQPVVGLRAAEHARAEHEVGLAVDHRLEHAGHVGRIPLAVGVERHQVARAVLAAQPVADPERRALAEVLLQPGDERAVRARDLARGVGAAVVDDDGLHGQAAGLGRHGVEHAADALGLVERGDDDDDRSQLELPMALAESADRLLADLVGEGWVIGASLTQALLHFVVLGIGEACPCARRKAGSARGRRSRTISRRG